jgi:uncharacterized heparinase superfamily protein
MKSLSELRMLFWTARYLTPAQVGHRGKRMARLRWRQVTGRRAPHQSQYRLASPSPLYAGLAEVADWESLKSESLKADTLASINSARALAERRFCFLNKRVSFKGDPGWHDRNLSQLWRYHLHYFDYVRDLLVWSATGATEGAYETFRSLAGSWINQNALLKGDGWHPFTISLRVVNWLHAVSGFAAQLNADLDFRDELVGSLYGQAQILFSDLEFDVRGNHLLENIRALLWAGIAFKGARPERWFRRALRILERETAEQVLTDGGHFERSPGYHLAVLKDFLEIALWLKRNRGNAPPWLDAALRRMLEYLWAILPQNLQVPMLKDTAWDAAPAPQDLFAAAALYFDEPACKRSEELALYPFLLFGRAGKEKFDGWPLNDSPRCSVALEESGHYVMRDDALGDHLIFDAGKACPDYLPAHAHADMLSYELTAGGERVVVDSGVYEYSAGVWRDYFRSTRAHNTVEVERENQSEVWGNFRVARRARPRRVFWRSGAQSILAQAEHDGYRRLPADVMHQRTVVWRVGKYWLIVDLLKGKRAISVSSFVHLHPNFTFEAASDFAWRIKGCSSPLWLTAFNAQGHSIIRGQMEEPRQGWYSEQFGQLLSNSVLTLDRNGAPPICFGYVISRDAPARVQMIASGQGREIAVTHGDVTNTLRLFDGREPDFA